jgi:hypothetical protein
MDSSGEVEYILVGPLYLDAISFASFIFFSSLVLTDLSSGQYLPAASLLSDVSVHSI